MFIHFVINTKHRKIVELFTEDELKLKVKSLLRLRPPGDSIFEYMEAYKKYQVEVEGCSPCEVMCFIMDGEIQAYLDSLLETHKTLSEQRTDIEGNYFR